MRVQDWMTAEVVTVGGSTSLREAAELMTSRKFRHLPVVEEGRLVGIVSERDLRQAMPSQVMSRALQGSDKLLDKACVRDIMTRRVVGVSPEVPIGKAAALMARNKIGCLPVLEGEALVGIITGSDILHAVAEEKGVVALPEVPLS
ncbi:MAG: CBS domain-containing protein [Candidatus Methylomirabilales bacterium]